MAAAPLAVPLVVGPGIGAVGLTAATGATAAVAVGGTAAALGTISTIATVAQFGLGVLGAGISVLGGNQAAASLEQQADLADTRARQELVIGKQQGNEVRRERIRALTAAAAVGAASGINVGTGPIGKGLVRDIDEDANRQIKIVRSNALVGEAAHRLAAANLRSQKKIKRAEGLLGAVGGLAQTINVVADTT